MRHLVERRYTFPGLPTAIDKFVECCGICQRTKSERGRHRGLLNAIELPDRRWQSVSMDWVALPSCQGFDSVLAFTDRATKMVHLVKARVADDALKIAQQLVTHIVRPHGLPRSPLSDRDPRLMSEVWRQLCELLDVKRSNTSGYYPQANGQAERTNQNVKQVLRVALAEHQNWVRALPTVEMYITRAVTASGSPPPPPLPQPRIRVA